MAVNYERDTPDYHLKLASLFADNGGDWPISIAFWVKAESHNITPITIISNTNTNGTARIHMSIHSDSTLRWEDGSKLAITTNLVSNGVWYLCVAVSVAVDNKYVVLNGDWANRGIQTGISSAAGLNRTSIGAYAGGANAFSFDGVIAGGCIWKGRALVESDIIALNSGAHPYTRNYGALSNLWKMYGDGPVGARLRDSVGGFHIDGTIIGTPIKTESPAVIRNTFMQGCC